MSVTEKFFLGLVLVIFLIIAAKPLFLGFYHDDWATLVGASFHGSAFSWERLTWALKTFASRAVGGLVVYVLSSVNGKSPLFWQGSIALLSFLVIAAQFLFLRRLISFCEESQKRVKSVLFSAIFFIYPWATGGINFVTAGIVVLPAMVFFLIAGYLVLRPLEKLPWKTIILAGFFYLLSGLVYEVFYFQFFLFVLLHLLRSKQNLKKLALLFAVFFFVQLLLIIWNRYVATLGLDPTKTVSQEWFSLLGYLTLNFPNTLRQALKQAFTDVPRLFAALEILIVSNFLILSLLLLKDDKKSFFKFLCLFSVFSFGILLSLALYALSGYGISGIGIFSRTMVVPSLFLSFLLFITDLFFQKVPKILRQLHNVSFFVIFVVLVLVSLVRLNDWKRSWDIQKEILKSVPKERILQTGKDALIVYRGPYETAGVTVFQAYWDIEGAVNAQFDNPTQFRHYTVGRDDWQTTWTGDTLVQAWQQADQIIWELPAGEVWLWDYPRNTFEQILTPGKI